MFNIRTQRCNGLSLTFLFIIHAQQFSFHPITLVKLLIFTLSSTEDRCSLQDNVWNSSIHKRDDIAWGSNRWMITGDVAIPKMSISGNSWRCWLVCKERHKNEIFLVNTFQYVVFQDKTSFITHFLRYCQEIILNPKIFEHSFSVEVTQK